MTNKVSVTDIPKETLVQIYRNMCLMREFEEAVIRLEASHQTRGLHVVYTGEEAVATGVCAALRDDDYVTSTHRGHGHAIARGLEMRGLMAEICGRATGICRGRVGTFHINDVSKGFLGATGVVGANLPLAVGAALTAKVKGWERVTVAFCGDGAFHQVISHECLNLAMVWKLPVIFVCENNLYAGTIPQRDSSALHRQSRDLTQWVGAYGIPFVAVDGMDVFAVYEAAVNMVKRTRGGDGPTFIEAHTYSFYGSTTWDTHRDLYRPKGEEESYRQRDPLKLFRQRVLEAGLLTSGELETIEKESVEQVKDAERFAAESPVPEVDELYKDVYSTMSI